MRFNRDGLILQTATLLLFLLALTGCSQTQVVLRGNQAIRLQPKESAPFQGWLIQDEALARILEKAEQCQKVKP